jgi:hypothetical protein
VSWFAERPEPIRDRPAGWTEQYGFATNVVILALAVVGLMAQLLL